MREGLRDKGVGGEVGGEQGRGEEDGRKGAGGEGMELWMIY